MTTKWLVELDNVFKSGAVGAILTFNTNDRICLDKPMFLKYALAQLFSNKEYMVGYYAISSGFQELVPPDVKHKRSSPFSELKGISDPFMLLNAFGSILKNKKEKILLILDYADHIAPQDTGTTAMLSSSQIRTLETLHSWALDDDIRNTANFVILISYEKGLNSLLTQSGGYKVVRINLPPMEKRLEFIKFLIDSSKHTNLGKLDPNISIEEFARLTGGLRLIDIEGLFRTSGRSGKPITHEWIREEKRSSISQICRGLVEVIEPRQDFSQVGGCEHVKEYFKKLKFLWNVGHKSVPQAILLCGVPGCGKSHLVLALAKELGCPCLVMRGIREAWVGASERNLELVLWVAENLSPCILWTDEVDQALGQRSTGQSGDSGTSERMLARIFEFFGSMQHRGKILWVASTNRPDILDPALLDRFQVIVPFIHPSRKERIQILPLLAKQIDRKIDPNIDISKIAGLQNLDLFTIRSLQEIIVRAGMYADTETQSPGSLIQEKHFHLAINDYKPTYNPVEHKFIALKALEMTTFNSLLPWMSSNYEREDIPSYIRGLVDINTGHLDPSKLSARIAELQKMLYSQRILR